MHKSGSSLSWRLWMTFVADLAILALHLPAVARARATHTYFWYGHPWQDISVDVFIFLFVAIALVAGVPVLGRGSAIHRIWAIAFLILPLYVFTSFVIWSFRLHEN